MTALFKRSSTNSDAYQVSDPRARNASRSTFSNRMTPRWKRSWRLLNQSRKRSSSARSAEMSRRKTSAEFAQMPAVLTPSSVWSKRRKTSWPSNGHVNTEGSITCSVERLTRSAVSGQKTCASANCTRDSATATSRKLSSRWTRMSKAKRPRRTCRLTCRT